MSSVVKSMDSALKSMDLEKVRKRSGIADKLVSEVNEDSLLVKNDASVILNQ